jgi:hypothetical protein
MNKKMREYERTTKECTIADWQPEVAAAVRAHIEKSNLGFIEQEILFCGETVSKRIRLGFFSRLLGNSNVIQHTGILLTSRWLIWATTDGKSGTSVASARVSEVQATDFHSDLVEDCGLQIFGFINQLPTRCRAFIGLGNEPAAEKLRQVLKASVEKAAA